MRLPWTREREEKKEESVVVEKTVAELEEERMIAERKQEEEFQMLRQMDAEARKMLQGEYLDRYLLAKELGLERQAEIARIEGTTNTTFIDLEEQTWILLKKMACRMGYSVGGKHYNHPRLEAKYSPVTEFTGKIARGAMLRYQELKDTFEEIKILHFDIGADPLMYGVKTWNGEELHFLIMLWE